MPFDPLTDEADAYMSDPRVNTFLVAGGYNGHMYGGNRNSSELKELYEKISANEDWAKKAIFYMNDEPMDQDQLCFRHIELQHDKQILPECPHRRSAACKLLL